MKHIFCSDFQCVTSVLASVLIYKWDCCELSLLPPSPTHPPPPKKGEGGGWMSFLWFNFHFVTCRTQTHLLVVNKIWCVIWCYCNLDCHKQDCSRLYSLCKGHLSSFHLILLQRWRRQWFLQSISFICTSQTPLRLPWISPSLSPPLSPFVFRLWEYGCMSSDCWIEILMWSIKACVALLCFQN